MADNTQHTEESDDIYRPGYHVTAPTGWINDPNGLVYFDGEYHLFYQYLWPRHWGHAVSSNLVHWTHLPIALAPDELGDIWSGSAVVDAHDTSGFFDGGAGLVAAFTHWKQGEQHQSIAYSIDRGRTWTKYAGNPVIRNPGFKDFRDPKVLWHAPTARWIMALAAGDRVQFYTSTNIREWTLASEFTNQELVGHGVFECPDLFEMPVDGQNDTRWVLHISTGGPPAWRTFHLIGTFDGQRFVAEAGSPIGQTDYGQDSYAHVSWSDIPPEHGQRVWIAWMNNWAYAERSPTGSWQGAMTIPRELSLVSDGLRFALAQRPFRGLQQLRRNGVQAQNQRLDSDTAFVPAIAGTQLEIITTIRLETALGVELAVRVGASERTTIGYDAASETLRIDRTQSGDGSFAENFHGTAEAPLALHNGVLRLHVFVDRCSVEVFGGEHVVISSLVYPQPTSDGIELIARGGSATLVSLEVFQLASSEV